MTAVVPGVLCCIHALRQKMKKLNFDRSLRVSAINKIESAKLIMLSYFITDCLAAATPCLQVVQSGESLINR